MNISRIQIEEGFLDGLDLLLSPGLNVLIGARGTGKTSLIELIRFCLGVKGYGTETPKKSLDHALSVLGSGQITITLKDGDQEVKIARSATDRAPRSTGHYITPIIFSQTEIENVGLQPSGRLALLDSFLGDKRRADTDELYFTAEIRSLTKEAESLYRELEELERQLSDIPAVDQQITQLMPAEQDILRSSADAAAKKQHLDALSEWIAAWGVTASAIDRLNKSVPPWRASLRTAATLTPGLEAWPKSNDEPLFDSIHKRVQVVNSYIQSALEELLKIEHDSQLLAIKVDGTKLAVEDQTRQLRRDIEIIQTGAGEIARHSQQLRERKAQLESLRGIATERRRKLSELLSHRSSALDNLEVLREQRFRERANAASQLAKELGPRISLHLTRSGQFDTYAAAIADALRGSGLKYGDLAPTLAKSMSPRELLDAADKNDFGLLSELTGISKDRAIRILTHLKESDLGALSTVLVEDVVNFQLLDGLHYKDISTCSTGQRCTVTLSMLLRHTSRLLIVDQPEDHIDNAFIADTLIRSILNRDPTGQIIFSTHNANIPVLGKADRVVQMGSDGKRGFALVADTLDAPAIVNAISTVMEGGAEAFGRRAIFYGRHKTK